LNYLKTNQLPRLVGWGAAVIITLSFAAIVKVIVIIQIEGWEGFTLSHTLLLTALELVALAAALALALWHPRSRAWLRALLDRPRLVAGGAGAFVLLVWGSIKLHESIIIDGTRYWWLFDDAMISMRYAHNLVQGHGLVWNPGEYVEGYSNMLWVLLMALVHLLPISVAHTSLVVGLINIALVAALMPIVARLSDHLGGDALTRALAVATLALNLYLFYWTLQGAEVILLALLWLWGLVCVLDDRAAQRVSLRPFLLFSLVPLVRADAVVLAGIGVALALLLLWPQVPTRRLHLLGFIALVGVPFLLHLLWRVAYYGDIVPNTAHLKVTGMHIGDRLILGLGYLMPIVYSFPLLTALLLTSPRREHLNRLLWSGALVYIGYLVFVGGDIFGYGRFFIPVLPLFVVLAFRSMQQVVMGAPRVGVGVMMLLCTPLILPPILTHRHIHRDNVALAVKLKQIAPPDAVVADTWAGTPFYYSGLRGVDLLGKNDAYIAHLPAEYGLMIGHNKMDLNYSLGVLKPDIVLGSFPGVVTEEMIQQWEEDELYWRSELYRNPLFLEHCRPYKLPVDTWRAIHVCDWSPHWSAMQTRWGP